LNIGEKCMYVKKVKMDVCRFPTYVFPPLHFPTYIHTFLLHTFPTYKYMYVTLSTYIRMHVAHTTFFPKMCVCMWHIHKKVNICTTLVLTRTVLGNAPSG
jgi:hypothetical protein